MTGFASKRIALKVDVLQEQKMYCLQAPPCIFQPGNFTGWGSEGINGFKSGASAGRFHRDNGAESVAVKGLRWPRYIPVGCFRRCRKQSEKTHRNNC